MIKVLLKAKAMPMMIVRTVLSSLKKSIELSFLCQTVLVFDNLMQDLTACLTCIFNKLYLKICWYFEKLILIPCH